MKRRRPKITGCDGTGDWLDARWRVDGAEGLASSRSTALRQVGVEIHRSFAEESEQGGVDKRHVPGRHQNGSVTCCDGSVNPDQACLARQLVGYELEIRPHRVGRGISGDEEGQGTACFGEHIHHDIYDAACPDGFDAFRPGGKPPGSAAGEDSAAHGQYRRPRFFWSTMSNPKTMAGT